MSEERQEIIEKVEGGKKIININGNQELRQVWREIVTGKYLIQYKNNMPEVKKEIINNIEIYTLEI